MIKKIFPLLFALSLMLHPPHIDAQQYPKPTGYVNDFAGVMNAGEKNKLESFLKVFTEKTGAEIAVAVVRDMGGLDENTYAVELMQKWGVGSKERNDGILILVAVKERRLRIEVGYGLEPVITDARAGQIRDKYMVPYLKNDDYSSGIIQGAMVVASIIAEDKGVSLDSMVSVPNQPRQTVRRKSSPAPFINIIVFFIIFMLLAGRTRWQGSSDRNDFGQHAGRRQKKILRWWRIRGRKLRRWIRRWWWIWRLRRRILRRRRSIRRILKSDIATDAHGCTRIHTDRHG